MSRRAINEWLTVRDAQDKIRAMTGANETQIDKITADARRVAEAQGISVSTAVISATKSRTLPAGREGERAVTQHLTVYYCPPGHQRGGQHRTACGRWVQPGQATGVAGTTCRRCLATTAYEARRDQAWAEQQARDDEAAEHKEDRTVSDTLTTLRAEVVRLIDGIRTELRDGRFEYGDDYAEPLAIGTGQILAYSRVLDLIDKAGKQ